MFGLIFGIIFAVCSVFVVSLCKSSKDREDAETLTLHDRPQHPFRK